MLNDSSHLSEYLLLLPLGFERKNLFSCNNIAVEPEANDDTASVFAVIPVNAASGPSPSLQDWPGTFDFKVSVKDSVRSRDPQVRII